LVNEISGSRDRKARTRCPTNSTGAKEFETPKRKQPNNNNKPPLSFRLPAGYLEGGSPQLPGCTPPPLTLSPETLSTGTGPVLLFTLQSWQVQTGRYGALLVSRDLIVHSSMALRHPTNTDINNSVPAHTDIHGEMGLLISDRLGWWVVAWLFTYIPSSSLRASPSPPPGVPLAFPFFLFYFTLSTLQHITNYTLVYQLPTTPTLF
jgi:hypothetical protein